MYADDSSETVAQSADFEQGPDEVVDYGFSWASRLDGDTIAMSTFELPDGLTSVSEGRGTDTDTETVIFVSGAQEGSRYRIVNTITTAAGRTWTRTIWIVGKEV